MSVTFGKGDAEEEEEGEGGEGGGGGGRVGAALLRGRRNRPSAVIAPGRVEAEAGTIVGAGNGAV